MPTPLLHLSFVAQAARRRDQPAVVAEDRTVTYGELLDLAGRWGGRLRALGARPNRLVAVVMEKGWEQVAAVLSVLASGAAYLPIDAGLPQERICHLLDDGQVTLALTQSRVARSHTWPPGVRWLCVDEPAPDPPSEDPWSPAQTPEDLAYVIYTSGSTGQPKGVMIDHQGVVNTIADINERFDVGPNDRVLAVSSLGFDLSVYDIFGTLAAGGTVVLPEASRLHDPCHWADRIVRQRVTIWNSVPCLMDLLVQHVAGRPQQHPSTLRLVLLSGDWIPLSLPDQVRAVSPGAQIISLGGATEASIWSILYPIGEVAPDWKSIPYGRAMKNQQFHVLDEAMEPCPAQVPGQLYIGGIGLTKGYWRDEEKTRASLLLHPRTGQRLYRTGDWGRYLPDGNIEFLGREDCQVKVQGNRVELGEIEAAMACCPGVRSAVAVMTGSPQGEKRLAGYFVPEAEATVGGHELRKFLKQRLPEYMVPSIFVRLEHLPLTANGKVDRRALPEPKADQPGQTRAFVPPHTPLEELLAGIWAEVLGLRQISVADDFFSDLGGQSLQAMRVVVHIRDLLDVDLSFRDFVDHPSVAALARSLVEFV